MRHEDCESDLRFTSRLRTLSVAFTGVNFSRKDTGRVAVYEVSKKSEFGKSAGIVRLAEAFSSWTTLIRQNLSNRLRRRRTLATLEGLDWQLLHDIGLSYNDVLDLRYGQISVEQINARKYSKDVSTKNACPLHIVPDRNGADYRGDRDDIRRAA